MRNKFSGVLATGIAVFGMVGIASATTINYSSLDTSLNKESIYTYFDDFQMETFNSVTPVMTPPTTGLDQASCEWTGVGIVVNGTEAGHYSAPYATDGRDITNYLSVPDPNDLDSKGTITADLSSTGITYDYFGLWWGSVDLYNYIDFYNNGALTQSFSGVDILDGNVDYGNQVGSDSNIYVNFMDLTAFDSFELTI